MALWLWPLQSAKLVLLSIVTVLIVQVVVVAPLHWLVFDRLSINGCHRWLVVCTTALSHRCILLGRHPARWRRQRCSLLLCGLVGRLCSSRCLPFSFASCLSLSLSLCVVVVFCVLDCLSTGHFSFALSCVSVALQSVAFSFLAFLSCIFSSLSLAFVFAVSLSFVDGSHVHQCGSSKKFLATLDDALCWSLLKAVVVLLYSM